MHFEKGKIIEDHEGENRWKVTGVIQRREFYSFYRVEDQAPGLERDLYLMCLNYDRLPKTEIQGLRHSFARIVEVLCMNLTYLPEPVDWIKFRNTEDKMDDAMRDDEPGLIFSHPEGFPLPKQTKPGKKAWQRVKSTVRSCSKTLYALHGNHVVIRSLPLSSIILSHTTFKPYFFGFDTLIRMKDFQGYKPDEMCLKPDPMYSAPECFDPEGYLSPATDVYALGKLVLQIILPDKRFKTMFPKDDPFPRDIQNRIGGLNLPDLWSRFLSLSLNPRPDFRFQNTYEVERFFVSGGKPHSVSSQRRQTEGNGDQSSDKPVGKYWRYVSNPQLPEAALVFWSPGLMSRKQRFNFRELYRKYLYRYSYEPRVYFQYAPKPLDETLSFFKMLKDTYRLNIVRLESKKASDQFQILLECLIPERISSLILVADSGQYPVMELLRHPRAKKWDITWIRSGEGRAPIPVKELVDAFPFISEKK